MLENENQKMLFLEKQYRILSLAFLKRHNATGKKNIIQIVAYKKDIAGLLICKK